jgi:hypothetical protein
MITTSTEELLAKHGIKLTSTAPGRYYTICPRCSSSRTKAHQDNKVLGVTIEDNGGVHWGCNHCNWTGPEKGAGNGHDGHSFAATYDYRDAGGKVQFQKVRNCPGHEPRFWCRRPDGRGGWINNIKGVSKPLYRLPEILQAIAQDREIAIVEGEKDADNLWRIGIPATCNFDGAADVTKNPNVKPKWKREYSAQLRGARLIVFNDHDPQGHAHADAVCRLSLGVAKRVRRLDLATHWPGMPKGADVSDWLALGRTREELEALIAQAPDYAPASEQPKAGEQPGSARNGSAAGTGSGGTIDDGAEIERLARLAALDYERARKAAGERLGIRRLSLLDSLVKAKRAGLGLDGGDDKQGEAIEFPEIEAWPEVIDGAQLLDDLATTIRSHVVMSDHERDICALWTVHSYLIRRFMISPKLWVRSTVKNCGKTTLLDTLSHLVFRAWVTGSITKAALFRVIAKWHPTLLIDEVDSFVGDDEELRGMLNNSHRYDGVVTRTVGDDHEPRKFSVYAAVALSGIGGIAATLVDRSVITALKRRRPNEPIKPLRIGRMGHLHELRRRITRWVADHEERVGDRDPKMPDGTFNREADNWTALLAIADEAGGAWPERARKAAVAAHIAHAADNASRTEQLLADVRTVFAKWGTKPDIPIPSATLVGFLVDLEGHPWAEYGKGGRALTQNQLARLLKPLGITPQKVGPKDNRVNGYVCASFQEVFERYLGPEGGSQPDTRTPCDEIRTSETSQPDSADSWSPVAKCEKPNNDGLESGCPVAKGENGKAHKSGAAEPCAPRSPESAPGTAEPCAYCGRPGGNLVAFGDGGLTRLHRHCEDPWIESRMAEQGFWRA